MTMTREQVRDWHREKAKLARCDGDEQKAVLHGEMADAIDAHIAEMGEPVATICDGRDIRFVGCAPIAEVARKRGLGIGTKLYLAPPIDLAAVREVIAHLRDTDEPYLADKLEAAIKGES